MELNFKKIENFQRVQACPGDGYAYIYQELAERVFPFSQGPDLFQARIVRVRDGAIARFGYYATEEKAVAWLSRTFQIGMEN